MVFFAGVILKHSLFPS
ncbi:MAG: hypothetical protein LW731_11220 [Oxalobacteraceae bacterium]|nr:hypothetical protein [Oxalobacteraceae bacterium]